MYSKEREGDIVVIGGRIYSKAEVANALSRAAGEAREKRGYSPLPYITRGDFEWYLERVAGHVEGGIDVATAAMWESLNIATAKKISVWDAANLINDTIEQVMALAEKLEQSETEEE